MRKVGKLKLKRMKAARRAKVRSVLNVLALSLTALTVISVCNTTEAISNEDLTVKADESISLSAGVSKAIMEEVVDISVESNETYVVTKGTTEDTESTELEDTESTEVETETEESKEITETKEVTTETKETTSAYKIRTTGYYDHGYMKGGKWTYDGAIAGKEEWLGKKCNLYRVNKDGTMGELIGTYTFEDTGYGINGSLVKGTSVDIWFSTEDEVWNFVKEYGDYTYIEFIE